MTPYNTFTTDDSYKVYREIWFFLNTLKRHQILRRRNDRESKNKEQVPSSEVGIVSDNFTNKGLGLSTLQRFLRRVHNDEVDKRNSKMPAIQDNSFKKLPIFLMIKITPNTNATLKKVWEDG